MGVIDLPGPLAPWASKLALFPRDVALALRPLVQRLHVLLGEGRGSTGETGEPDGYDGIARRGPYERLLAAEWLIHAELPDEFMRRVAAGEHSFLKLARRPPVGGRRAVVLFDAGPDQLGGPRVVHLAALVVLAARLERQRGTLSWGALQDENATPEEGVTRASVEALLAARSPRAVARGDVEKWLAGAGVRGASERWLVGAEDLRSPEERRSTSMLVVSEAPEPGARRLFVRVLPAGGARQAEAALDLPDDSLCIRLLREPFGAGPAPKISVESPLDPEGGLVFAENGRRLYVRSGTGQLLIFVVPNSPRTPVPPHGVFEPPPEQVVLAAGIERAKSRTVVVCAGEGAYFSHRMSVSRRVAFESREHRLKGPPRATTGRPGPLAELSISEDGVLRFAASPEEEVVLAGESAWYERRTPVSPGVQGPPEERAEAREPARLWTLAGDGEGAEPSGIREEIFLGGWQPREARVVLVRGARNRVLVEHPMNPRAKELKVLFSTTSPVVATRVSAALGLVGFLTEDGQIGVHSRRANDLVLHSLPGGPSR